MSHEVILFGRLETGQHVYVTRQTAEGDGGRKWAWQVVIGKKGQLRPAKLAAPLVEASTWPSEPSLIINLSRGRKIQLVDSIWHWVTDHSTTPIDSLDPSQYVFDGTGLVTYRLRDLVAA